MVGDPGLCYHRISLAGPKLLDVERKADHGPARGCSRGVSAGDNLGPMTSPPPADSGVPWSLVQLGSRGLTPEASEQMKLLRLPPEDERQVL